MTQERIDALKRALELAKQAQKEIERVGNYLYRVSDTSAADSLVYELEETVFYFTAEGDRE